MPVRLTRQEKKTVCFFKSVWTKCILGLLSFLVVKQPTWTSLQIDYTIHMLWPLPIDYFCDKCLHFSIVIKLNERYGVPMVK